MRVRPHVFRGSALMLRDDVPDTLPQTEPRDVTVLCALPDKAMTQRADRSKMGAHQGGSRGNGEAHRSGGV